jgi:hypothetical protein
MTRVGAVTIGLHSVTMRVGAVNPCQAQSPFWVGAVNPCQAQSPFWVGAVSVRVRAGMITVGAVNNSSTSSQLFEIANAIAAHSYPITLGWGPRSVLEIKIYLNNSTCCGTSVPLQKPVHKSKGFHQRLSTSKKAQTQFSEKDAFTWFPWLNLLNWPSS